MHNLSLTMFEDLDESMRAQYQTAEHLTQICSEMKDTSDSENEDVGCNSSFEKTQASPSKAVEEHDIRPSMVAAYEKQRTSGKRKQENVFAVGIEISWDIRLCR